MLKIASAAFAKFAASEQAGSLLLIASALIALLLANSTIASSWAAFWHTPLGGLALEAWVNDLLMAVFFLLIGLELARELRVGELSDRARALLPAVAALGGMLVPAAIHATFNVGQPTARGFGIPMATDIAFALGVLTALGPRIPLALRVFVVAFAVIDDLGAIVVIALFYSDALAWPWVAAAVITWCALFALNRLGRLTALAPYLLGGALLWLFTLKSGVHATLAGVALAFAIPSASASASASVPSARRHAAAASDRLETMLHAPVAFVILPIFALANAGVRIDAGSFASLASAHGLGVLVGLVLGKPIGILLFAGLATALGWSRLPAGLGWRHLTGAGLLGGIGFTMAIFIANLAFPASPEHVATSKLAILVASTTSALLGAAWLLAPARRAGG